MVLDNKFLKIPVLVFISLSLLLVRSFTGIYIFNFRIGEIVIAFCFLTSIIFILKFLFFNNIYSFEKEFKKEYILIFTMFFLTILSAKSLRFDIYLFKSSSYIWVVSIFFLSNWLSKKIFLDTLLEKTILILTALIYLISVVYIPENLTNFLITYSDKFELHKGSDLLITYILFCILYQNKTLQNKNNFYLFSIITGFYLPLLAVKSRAALIAALIYLIFFLIFIVKNKIGQLQIFFFILFSFISLIISTNLIANSNLISSIESDANFIDLIEFRNQPYYENNIDGTIPILYIYEKRLFSGDGNLNWRLQIWQDTIQDTIESPKVLFLGHGYEEILPSMDQDIRKGKDGLNENVHNYFINIFARGGIINFIIFILINIKIIKTSRKTSQNFNILMFMVPIIFVSLFDSSMENAHFPIIYYFFLARLLNIDY